MAYWQDKIAIVTGASAGLGWALCCELARQKARVVLAARDAERLEYCREELIRQHPTDVLAISTDVTKDDQVARLVDETRSRFGRLDALVNCAGRSARGALRSTSAADCAELMELNFYGLVRCTQAALPLLLDARGHVINIGSLASKTAAPHLGAYAASKFAVAAYSQQLRLELADLGLHVLLVCPGPLKRKDAGARYDVQAAGLPDTAREPGGGVKLRGIDPVLLAGKILKAAEARRPELIVPGRARWLFAIAQLWPSWGDSILRRMTS
ncbi:MAG: SDR family NAD(P)-dependent oxidoreductase [Planctomycetota bacterium]|nr:MAG: SDR family NAD(P)-dependent oxidoreductase [Planctomycetota bacterium]REJ92978.1 MAG: SDR family NAD(P)-dependent oxidoreductase [Planctomycetota bacterium]REK30588.1 MAG: SDR family NAD(P)-dependent oxidoreductase [Planctomycetota bacterium]REK46012.1 MAG: SDR family NAD(P)-dependent oxidoreductase [Planctomycetota bacterium]